LRQITIDKKTLKSAHTITIKRRSWQGIYTAVSTFRNLRASRSPHPRNVLFGCIPGASTPCINTIIVLRNCNIVYCVFRAWVYSPYKRSIKLLGYIPVTIRFLSCILLFVLCCVRQVKLIDTDDSSSLYNTAVVCMAPRVIKTIRMVMI